MLQLVTYKRNGITAILFFDFLSDSFKALAQENFNPGAAIPFKQHDLPRIREALVYFWRTHLHISNRRYILHPKNLALGERVRSLSRRGTVCGLDEWHNPIVRWDDGPTGVPSSAMLTRDFDVLPSEASFQKEALRRADAYDLSLYLDGAEVIQNHLQAFLDSLGN